MGYDLTAGEVNDWLAELGKTYDVYAPKRFPYQGRYAATDLVKYDKIQRFEDIEWRIKSDFPAKEVINPIQETIFHFNEEEYTESKGPKKPKLIFARPCDINAQRIQAEIFTNGGIADSYYWRVREQVKFILMDCNGGDDTCFCVSMGMNKTEDYAIAVKFREDGMLATVRDESFLPFFALSTAADYTPQFVEGGQELSVEIPDLSDPEVLLALKKHPMWNEYNKRCISCGACTVACSTCTCFQTRDVVWGENTNVGERRRISQSCQVPGYDRMAGQREMRADAGSRMRYKVLHKFYAHHARFGTHQMCIGCGRCIHRCPENISIVETMNKVNKAVQEIQENRKKEEVEA